MKRLLSFLKQGLRLISQFLTGRGAYLLIGVVMLAQLAAVFIDIRRYENVSYSEMLGVLTTEQTEKVLLYSKTIELCTVDKKCLRARHGGDTTMLEAFSLASGGKITYSPNRTWAIVWPILFLIGLTTLFIPRPKTTEEGEETTTLFKSMTSRLIGSAGEFVGKTGVTFANVAGYAGPKQDLMEVVEALRDPQRYIYLGAKLPRGILLCGPPGTGKTLLARATAGGADVPFLMLSGSDLTGVYVSTGTERVKDIFARARAAAAKFGACIIFIDEFDALGNRRGDNTGATRDMNNTINQLLVEMDGFNPASGIIVLAATNNPERLDPALVRAGRFDRKITVPVPLQKDREEILALHGRGVRLDGEVNWQKIAQLTPGMVGADLANVVAEAARLAARLKAAAVTEAHICDAIEHLIVGHKAKGHRLSENDRRAVAVHESGHAVALAYIKAGHRVRLVSIMATMNGALGYNLVLPEDEADALLQTEEELQDAICHLLGGRAAEKVVLGHITTGASDDIARATTIARRMVMQYGMSTKLHNLHLSADGWSGSTLATAEDAIAQIVAQCFERTLKVMEDNRSMLDAMTAHLLEHEELEGEALQRHLEAIQAAALNTVAA